MIAMLMVRHRHAVCIVVLVAFFRIRHSALSVARSAFSDFFERDQCHSAFGTLAWFGAHHFRMHEAGVELSVFLVFFLFLSGIRAIGVNRLYLCAEGK